MEEFSEEDYEEALRISLDAKGYTKEAERILRKGVAVGHGRSTYALATWYLFGVGEIPEDHEEGNRLLELAGKEAVAEAWFDLAVSFEKGAGKVKSVSQAVRCYIIAAMLGDKKSLFEVGRALYHHDVDLSSIQDQLGDDLLGLADVLGVFDDDE
ncbi:MAG: hypothetical protein L3J04_00020 [Robiginitomaculum sp.]|nr:hypothetical protein [Robiginitomaculum sp.]